MRNAIFLLLIFGLVATTSCGKKARSIEQMASSRDINGLSDVVISGSEKADRRLAAAHALVQLDLANRLMENVEKLGPQNPEAAKELVAALARDLTAQLKDDSPKSVMARDALVTLFPRMSPDAASAVADGVFKWMADGMDKRADCGNFKLLKILEMLGPAASDATVAALAVKHAAWMLADFKNRGEDGTLIFRRAKPEVAQIKPTVHRDTYARYWKPFRKGVLDGVVASLDVTSSEEVVTQNVTIIRDYAEGDERPKAGAVLLEQMKSKQKATAMSVRAVGELGTVGAVEYLRNWMKPGIPDDLRDSAFAAVTVLQQDPASAAVLYELSKPMFEAMLRKELPDEKPLQLALKAIESLKFSRKCELPEGEYKLVRDLFKMKMDGTLFKLREGMMLSLQRLMLCTGKTQGLREIQASLRFPLKPEELGAVAAVLDTLPEAELLPILRKDLSSKKTELAVLAVMALGAYGQKDDLTLLEGMKSSPTPIPDWNKTLGALAGEAATQLKTKFPTTN